MTTDPTAARPQLSVIIPAYNAVATLGEQLEALAGQRLDEPWEILVCDNGSSDGLADFVERWRARLPQLRLIDASARRGPSAARNAGARASHAEYLLFCDADDVAGADWLPTFAAALQSNAFVGGRVEYERLRPAKGLAVSWASSGPFALSVPPLPELPATGSNNLGIRRDVYLAVGGFEEGLQSCEDVDLSWRVQLAGHPLTFCTATLHVRPRRTIRGIWRQSRGWGSGDATLRHRYARVRAALDALPHEAAASDTGSHRTPEGYRIAHYFGVIARRLAHGELGALVANATWQLGHRVGVRSGKPDLSIAQIAPPPDLARVTASQARTSGAPTDAQAAAWSAPR